MDKTQTNITILLADEDGATLAFLADNLLADGYDVLLADCRAKAMTLLSVNQPDLIVADINPATLDVIDALRSGECLAGEVDPDTPLIVLSARDDELHRTRVLERGGDDIVAKPLSYLELRARIVALLRRTGSPRRPRVLCAGPLRIDLRSRDVRVGDRQVALTALEYDLLVRLAVEPTRVLTRSELMHDVWGFRSAGPTRTLDTIIYRLRGKLRPGEQTKLVISVRGVGFRLL